MVLVVSIKNNYGSLLAVVPLPRGVLLCVYRISQFLRFDSPSFSRETPRRFKKEVLSPYVVNDSVDVEALNKLLTNIGHSQDCLNAKEQSLLLEEAGCSGRSIPVPKLAELID